MKFLILISILYNNEYWVLWLHRKVEYSDKVNSFDYSDYLTTMTITDFMATLIITDYLITLT